MKRKKGSFLINLGLLLLAAALCLTGYNIYESKNAQAASENAMVELGKVLAELEDNTNETETIPEYVMFPEKELPTLKIDKERYIGILSIPSIDVSLPVMGGKWSYAKLRSAPCRYYGSVYKDNMIIAAHNYSSHFGKINRLMEGDQVQFIDVDGNVFNYTVGWLEVLQPYEVEALKKEENWDLTLFTCTFGGAERYVLRCVREK